MVFLSWSCSLRYFHIWWNQLILHPSHCVLFIVEGGDADGDLGVSGFEVVQHCMELIDSNALRTEYTSHDVWKIHVSRAKVLQFPKSFVILTSNSCNIASSNVKQTLKMGASGNKYLSLWEVAANILKSHSWESTHATVLTQHVGKVANFADESFQ